MKRIHILLTILVVVIAALSFRREIRGMLSSVANRLSGRATVTDRLEQYGEGARTRLAPRFKAAGVQYPPDGIIIVGLKQEKVLEVWVRDDEGPFHLIKTYPVLGTSGDLGPKLKEGDMQIPEGIYSIKSLNPNSRFHLSLRLDYPNDFDRQHAREDGRKYPGSDIMIHGSTCSIGCLAMGDEVAEELFVLAADTGLDSIKVVLSPVDFRKREMPELDRQLPQWSDALYAQIRQDLAVLNQKDNE